MKVAFIGIGNMGKPMAANIAKGGHQVFLFDANPAAAASAAKEMGATALESLAEISTAEVIVTMLPDGNVVREVALGANGIAAAAKPGTIVVDMSSSQPLITRATGSALADKKITLIDAPVSGGVAKAVAGTLTIMIGGDDPASVERVKPVLACMGTTFFEVGKLGSGHAAKALNNVAAAANYAALAEALLVGEKFGIDRGMLVDIVNASTGQSFISTVVMKQFVLPGTFNTGFAIGLLAKDANIAAELSQGLSCKSPLMELASKRWAEARDALGGSADNSRAIQAWAKPQPEGELYE
jgi:3-hydroxyisobutyrate dehydrogenase